MECWKTEKGLSEVCLETVFIACLKRFIFKFLIRSKFNLLVCQRVSLTRIFSWLKKKWKKSSHISLWLVQVLFRSPSKNAKCKSLKQNFNKTIYSLRHRGQLEKSFNTRWWRNFGKKINRTELAQVVIFLLAQWSCSVYALPCWIQEAWSWSCVYHPHTFHPTSPAISIT